MFGSNQYIAKKDLKSKSPSSVFEGVKRQEIASGCSKNLCLISPKDFQPRFLEAHACCLLQRQTRQVVRLEEFVREHTGNKITVSLRSTFSSDLVAKMSGHQLSALQFCAYKQSSGMMLIASVVQVGISFPFGSIFARFCLYPRTFGACCDVLYASHGAFRCHGWQGWLGAQVLTKFLATTPRSMERRPCGQSQ